MRRPTHDILAPLAGAFLFLGACDPPQQKLTDQEVQALVVPDVPTDVTAVEPTDPNSETADQPEAAAEAGVPAFDTVAYCRKVSEVGGGGSYSIEKTCRDMEANARSELSNRSISSRIYNYCKQVAEVGGGGSYSIMNTCVDMELKSASEL